MIYLLFAGLALITYFVVSFSMSTYYVRRAVFSVTRDPMAPAKCDTCGNSIYARDEVQHELVHGPARMKPKTADQCLPLSCGCTE